jgi:hypothetical protein
MGSEFRILDDGAGLHSAPSPGQLADVEARQENWPEMSVMQTESESGVARVRPTEARGCLPNVWGYSGRQIMTCRTMRSC